MKNLSLTFALFTSLLFACSSDDEAPSGPSGLGGEAAPAAYDESLLPTPTSINNLINNGDFESDEAWFTCGSVDITSTAEGQVMAISSRGKCEEASGTTFTVNAVAAQEIALNAVPELLTVSFRVRADGVVPSLGFSVHLGNTPQATYGFGLDAYFLSSLSQEEDEDGSWNRINLLVTRSDIEIGLDAASPLFLIFEVKNFAENSSTVIYLDDIIVTEGVIQLTQPSPMPEALRNYAGNSRLVFYDLSSGEEQVASMLPNGTDRVIHSRIDAATTDGAPRWFGMDQVVLSQKVFNPAAPSDATIEPGGGSNVTRYDLTNGGEEIIARTVGEPGKFVFPGSLDNRAALDIEVRRNTWDLARNRGVLNACGRNRSPELGLNSDDICWLNLVDATTFEPINEAFSVRGFAPKWSSSGRLVYYWDNAIYVADVQGGNIDAEVVYEQGGLLQAFDWSPDGAQIVFAKTVSSSGLINSEDITIYAIATLDIATGREEVLIQVDQGELIPNLSWSPDGDFIVYSLNTEQGAQVWWLEVATGQTGPITNTINGFAASWQK